MKRKNLTKQQRTAILQKYNCKCAYCGEDITLKTMQVDHIHAIYNGGDNEVENLNPSCRACNFYKGAMDVETFRKALLEILPKTSIKTFPTRLAIKYGMIEVHPWDGKFYFEKLN